MNKKEFKKTASKIKSEVFHDLDVEFAKLYCILVSCQKVNKGVKFTDSTEVMLFNTIIGVAQDFYNLAIHTKTKKRLFNRHLSDETFFSCVILLRTIFEGFLILKWILDVKGNTGLAAFRKNIYRLKGYYDQRRSMQTSDLHDSKIKSFAPNFFSTADGINLKAIQELTAIVLADPNITTLDKHQVDRIRELNGIPKDVFPLNKIAKGKDLANQTYQELSSYAHMSSHVLPGYSEIDRILNKKLWLMKGFSSKTNNILATSLALMLNKESIDGLLNGDLGNIFKCHIDKDVIDNVTT